MQLAVFVSLSCAAFVGAVVLGCSSWRSVPAYDDAFAYCEAVGDIDVPDDRYGGPKPPAAALRTLRVPAYGSASVVWRCMGGEVYACNHGANIPCMEKADLGRTPNEGMTRYCTAHPDADFIPMSASGHASVHAWACTAGQPEITGTFASADPRGFIAGAWTRITGKR